VTTENPKPDDEPYWFRFSVTLRIFGQIPDLDEITRILGISPTYTHKRGDQGSRRSRPFKHDMWSYESPVPDDRPLDVHLRTLWAHIQPHKDYLLRLKERFTVDVFSGYRSNCGTAGFEVSYQSLEMFIQLEIPFGVSVIV